jgi:X-X-X-Leu-X-X-Gly heptad repeat protein
VVWWLVGGLVLLGVVLLAVVCAPVLRRLDPLRRAAERLQERERDARALQAGVERLAASAADLQAGLAEAQAWQAARQRPES